MTLRAAALLFGAATAALVASAPAGPVFPATPGEPGAGVVWERVAPGPAPQAGGGYWTPERMAAAQPLDLVIGAAGVPEPQVAPDTIARRVPRPYTTGAKRQSGTVYFKIPGGPDAACSGTAAAGANGAVVWTAAHCTFHVPAQKFMKNWIFVPAFGSSAGDRIPFGKWHAEFLGVPTQWANSANFRFDVGAVVVSPKRGDTLVDRVGGQEIAFDYATDPSPLVRAVGYPAGAPFEGNRQYRCRSPLKLGSGPLAPGPGPAPVNIKCDMTGGSSGGGWRADDTRDVLSVVSYAFATKPNRRYGPYQGNAAQQLFECAEDDFTSNC